MPQLSQRISSLAAVLFLLLAADCQAAPVAETIIIVDVLAVVDKPMFNKWINAPAVGTKDKVIAEIKSLFFEVNVLYQTLQEYDLNIEIRLQDILFPESSIVPSNAVKNNVVTAKDAGKFFLKWLSKNNIDTYDHAMYFIKYDLLGSSLMVKGGASLRAACKTKGTSILEAHLAYNTAYSAAHELGHSLGAEHDESKKCLKGYIMSPGLNIASPNKWNFSECSANAIKKYINGLGKNNCLVRSGNDPIVSKRIGELFDKTSFCKKLYGNKVSPSYASGDKLCRKLACSDGKRIRMYSTPEGIRCNPDNKCYLGRCI